MGEWSGIEGRQHDRIEVNQWVKVIDAGHEFETLLKDISLGGALLVWLDPKVENDEITVKFATDLSFDAEVRWCAKNEKSYEIGVQFKDLDEVAALYLGDYIQSLQKS